MSKTQSLFDKIKKEVLGSDYDLSFAFITPVAMRRVMKYKKLSESKLSKTKTSNVLSFPLSKTSGEILICKSAAKPFTPEFLFIHGLFHLRGSKHGATMEKLESKLLLKFGLKQYANDHWDRRRHLPRKSSNSRAV